MINSGTPARWRPDLTAAQLAFEAWYATGGRLAYRVAREAARDEVTALLDETDGLQALSPALLRRRPQHLATLRMTTAPPMARERLAELARAERPVIHALEQGRLPSSISSGDLDAQLGRICRVLTHCVDPVLVGAGRTAADRDHVTMLVADRRCDAVADQILRQALRDHRRTLLRSWLEDRGYTQQPGTRSTPALVPGSFRFGPQRVEPAAGGRGLEADLLVAPAGRGPRLVALQEVWPRDLRVDPHGRLVPRVPLRPVADPGLRRLLLLGNAVDLDYLQDRAQEGVDWIWEHRVADLAQAGL
ncbi:XamI restriction endonuclease [Friedmanniella luteola]|uniref:XamI restriction endonuclease n=1 Tax=Friedmanniella luteola TaxID=546871 RepID=A0A1H1YE88_9ACTN|nr:XamI family restriction endonuclease [Friedmanniella luteola]SDT19763.1 XamI restriction endonuclease [Friedmanniella luteola]